MEHLADRLGLGTALRHRLVEYAGYATRTDTITQIVVAVSVLVFFTHEQVPITEVAAALQVDVTTCQDEDLGRALQQFVCDLNTRFFRLPAVDDDDNDVDITLVRSLQRGNSTVFLGLVANRLVVVKEHLLVSGAWRLTHIALYEIFASIEIAKHYRGETWYPRIHGAICHKNSTRLLMEYLPLGFSDVFDRRLPASFVKAKFVEVLRAVDKLHAIDIAHRDLKSANFRLRANGTIVLIDFDSAVSRNAATTRFVTRPVSTLHIRPPEVFQCEQGGAAGGGAYDAKKLDVFALGCLLFAMVSSGRQLFTPASTESEMVAVLASLSPAHSAIKTVATRTSPAVVPFLFALLATDPAQRPTVRALLAHPFLQPH
jgi:hypothetical protein